MLRLSTITFLAFHTSRTGIPKIGLDSLSSAPGLTISLVSLIYGTASLILALINPSQADPGIPTLIVFLFFFSGIQFLVLGILGEYIFSIYRHVRPEIQHTIVEKINLSIYLSNQSTGH